jgi:hypothetical protein
LNLQEDHICNIVDREFTTKGLDPKLLTTTELTAQTFASFFPYTWKFIYAKVTDPTIKAEWKTETRYPLTGRRLYDNWADPATIIGVRFDNQTEYAMLDIDKGSPYHPSQNYEKFKNILQALEDIGLVRPLIIQSSYSEGLHIYYPLWQEVPSFGIACAIKACLKKHNYEIAAGVLETFPNTKKYDSEYNGHRLPLQTGSYMLNSDLQIIGRDLNQFVEIWLTIQEQQDLELLKQAIDEAKTNYEPPKDNRKLIKWREDLEKQIQEGWTGRGQSNQLLYTMGKYARIFLGCEDIEAIARYISKTARITTGFQKFCGEIKRLEQKAEAIAKWCLKNHFGWGSKKNESTEEEAPLSKTSKSQKAARQAERIERIRMSVDELNKTGEMPTTIRGMAQAIAQVAKVSVQTLYDLKELWHPEFTETKSETSNKASTSNPSQSEPTIAPDLKQAENETESNVTDKPLYKALGLPETPLRGQELPKIAEPDFPLSPNQSRDLQKSNQPMWIEMHGRLKPPKNENGTGSIAQNPKNTAANADCFKAYEPPQEEQVLPFKSRIGYIKTLLNTPVLRRGKSVSEIARLEAELEMLEEMESLLTGNE